jgi:hypothetical protein
MSLVAAIASAFRGAKFVHVDEESAAQRHVARGGRHHAPAASSTAPAAASGATPMVGGSGAALSSVVPAEPDPVRGK